MRLGSQGPPHATLANEPQLRPNPNNYNAIPAQQGGHGYLGTTENEEAVDQTVGCHGSVSTLSGEMGRKFPLVPST